MSEVRDERAERRATRSRRDELSHEAIPRRSRANAAPRFGPRIRERPGDENRFGVGVTFVAREAHARQELHRAGALVKNASEREVGDRELDELPFGDFEFERIHDESVINENLFGGYLATRVGRSSIGRRWVARRIRTSVGSVASTVPSKV